MILGHWDGQRSETTEAKRNIEIGKEKWTSWRQTYQSAITAFPKVVPTLPIMRNNSTIFRTALIRTNASNHNSISSWTSTTIRSTCQDRKLEVRSRADKWKAFVVIVLVRVAISTNCLPRCIVGKCCCSCIVDILLTVFGPWVLLEMKWSVWGENWPSQSELLGSSDIDCAATETAKRNNIDDNFILKSVTLAFHSWGWKKLRLKLNTLFPPLGKSPYL